MSDLYYHPDIGHFSGAVVIGADQIPAGWLASATDEDLAAKGIQRVTPDPKPEVPPFHDLVQATNGATITYQVVAWPQERIDAEAEQASRARIAEIIAELDAIDAASARPLRAIATATATQADHDRLAELEARANILRPELAAIPAPL